mmetsp:Transcript_4771/g.10146  ORF Transcript_4771/g.10146 Transcript_4771/m.10146 type:complete len:300 (+) Transcript_4771:121-1020(+)
MDLKDCWQSVSLRFPFLLCNPRQSLDLVLVKNIGKGPCQSHSVGASFNGAFGVGRAKGGGTKGNVHGAHITLRQLSITLQGQQDRRGCNIRQLVLGSGRNVDNFDAKVLDRWLVPSGEFVNGSSILNIGFTRLVGKHVDQGWNILELGRQSGANNIVGAGHALQNFTRNVSMWFVGANIKTLSVFQFRDVEHEWGKDSAVTRELLFQLQDELLDIIVVLHLTKTIYQVIDILVNDFIRLFQVTLEHVLKRILHGFWRHVQFLNFFRSFRSNDGFEFGVFLQVLGNLSQGTESNHGAHLF